MAQQLSRRDFRHDIHDEACEAGQHDIRRDRRGRQACRKCGLSLQTISDTLGHQVEVQVQTFEPTNGPIEAWARCMGERPNAESVRDSNCAFRKHGFPKRVKVPPSATYQKQLRHCRECGTKTWHKVAGRALPKAVLWGEAKP